MARPGGQCLNFKWPEVFRRGVFLLWSSCIWPLLRLLGHTTDQGLTPDGKKRPSRKDYPKMHQKACPSSSSPDFGEVPTSTRFGLSFQLCSKLLSISAR